MRDPDEPRDAELVGGHGAPSWSPRPADALPAGTVVPARQPLPDDEPPESDPRDPDDRWSPERLSRIFGRPAREPDEDDFDRYDGRR